MIFLRINLIFLVIILTLVSCSNIEPLYKDNKNYLNDLNRINVLPIGGRYGVVLHNELTGVFGSSQSNYDHKEYTLRSGITIGKGGVQAFNDDGTASRFRIFVTISYDLYDSNDCGLLSKTYQTRATANSKSGGYDYGNIASEKNAIITNIKYNVRQFYPQIYKAISEKDKNKPPAFLVYEGCR